ncbi:MAG: hypothetical protein K9W44_01800 [Candidatus Lokiarchaeota archaeon]|nr:hypothetical protein [Candidatus Harpocratesius repetitus]
MVRKKKQFCLIISLILGMSVLFSNFSLIRAQQSQQSIETEFKPGNVFLYKNEHYDLDSHGNRFHNITKWSEIKIDDIISNTSLGTTTVIFSKYDANNVSLEEIEQNPDVLQFGFQTPLPFGGFTLGVINQSQPLSKYQVLFNEKNASMQDVTSDILINGQYRIFYLNELGYFDTKVNEYSQNNEVKYYNLEGIIQNQRERTLLATLDGDANILLNGSTYPNHLAWYNISLDLKLYLVYGQKSNILLSYNINFTIAEHFQDINTLEITNRYQRKIIFWNIRKPDELTKDYPILEVLDLPEFNLNTVAGISLASFVALVSGIFTQRRRR